MTQVLIASGQIWRMKKDAIKNALSKKLPINRDLMDYEMDYLERMFTDSKFKVVGLEVDETEELSSFITLEVYGPEDIGVLPPIHVGHFLREMELDEFNP